ncbi:phosphotransferase enzyme family protein [Streptomyces zingiberis]|uniref:Aminoglycoside phosphotransferase family protein n=1 Tax=Streptomyces zingiberis TaxID=2053010 RepID=A0ABX1C345_9ACTN|nr:aminoglycoside phosphotransferase family protein [Streptomyces zingiberis]NJQ03063.1 aminoglycoside phosphotransferase family protein [Streptomyces zingiberis]
MRVNFAESADHLAALYGLGPGPWTLKSVARGATGRVWRLSGEGPDWAVKELLFGFDAGQVRDEAALRDAAAARGVLAPRFLTSRDGSHTPALPPEFGPGHVKLYEWVEGVPVDATAPEVLDWVGATLARIHLAGVAAREAPDDWYQRAPETGDWTRLLADARAAGASWAGELAAFVEGAVPSLAAHIEPAAEDELLVSHRDLQPQNVLRDARGPVLLDWDDTGPTTAERELASVLHMWSGRQRPRADAARRLWRSYRDAGGPGRVRDLDSFSAFLAGTLNFLYVQARDAVDPGLGRQQRSFADAQVPAFLPEMPRAETLSRLVEAVDIP